MIAAHRQSITSTLRTITLLAAMTSLLLTMVTPFVGTAQAANLSVADDLDQWANGQPGTDPAVAGFWRNGNLNPNNSQYAEGESVAFRRELNGFTAGETYKVSINYDTVNNGLVAYDYLTSWNRTETEADPTAGKAAFSGAPDSLGAITTDPRLASTPGYSGTPSGPAEMAAWGADVLYVGNYRYFSGNAGTSYSPDSTTTTTVDVIFEATGPDVLLAWGGHIAVQAEWDASAGFDTAPRNTSGSPYHMRNTDTVQRLDTSEGFAADDPTTWVAIDSGNAGNQDRSIKAGAILLPGLNLTKATVDDVATVAPGDSFTYRLVVSNTGEAGSALTNVVVTDDVPPVFDVTAVTPTAACGFVDQLVTCNFASLAAGASVTIDISVDVSVDPTIENRSCGVYPNIANATADGDFAEHAEFTVTVDGCDPDLDIVKSTDLQEPAEGDPVVQFGDTFNYVLTVTNASTATALAVNTVVVDTIEDAFSITGTPTYSGDAAGNCEPPAGQVITCNLGDMAPGDQIVITIPVSVATVVDGCDSVPNTATADADNHAAVDSNTVDVVVAGCAPDVSLDKTADVDEVDVDGGTASYTLTATNAADATATATGVTVEDAVPAIFDIDSATYSHDGGTATACTLDGNDVTCGPVDLAPGESIVVTIDVTADATNVTIGQDGDYCGIVTNAGQVLIGTDVVDEDDTDIDVIGCDPTVTLTKTADVDEVDVDGGTASYTLTATNAADATATATGVTVEDAVPAIFDIDSATYSHDGGTATACTLDGNDVTCGPVDLAPGESIVVTIDVTADATNVTIGQDGDYCGIVTNAGQVLIGTDVVDEDDTDIDVVGCDPDLDIVKSTDLDEPAEGNAVVDLGESFNYLLTVSSDASATSTSTNVVVTDTIEDAFAITDTPSFAGDATGDCEAPVGQVVTCNIGDLAPGDTVTITVPVQVRVVADSCDTYPNTATADADNIGPVESNLVNVDVEGCIPDLDLIKTADAETVDVNGGTASYTMTATNDASATATATGITVEDTVPAIFDIDSATYSHDGGADTDCTVVGNDVTCGPVDLAPGESIVVTIDVTADTANVEIGDDGDYCGVVTNAGVLFEGDVAVDEDDVDVEVDGCDPDVSLLKSVQDDVTEVSIDGGTATFVLDVTNDAAATAMAEDVTVTDVVDDAFAIVAVTPAEDCGVVEQTVTCGPTDLAPGETYTVTIEVEAVGGPDSCGTFPNTFDVAWTDGYDGDSQSETSNEVELDVVGCVPAIDLVKDVDVIEAAIGDIVTYTYTITNTGDLTLTNIQLVDLVEVNGIFRDLLELLGFDTTITLAPGESTSLTAVHLVTEDDLPGPIDNVATVTGETEDGEEVSDTDDETVNPFGDPSILLDKVVAIPGADPDAPSIGVDPDQPGDTVIPYEFTVTNTGNVTLTDVTLTDIVLTEIPAGGPPTYDQAEQVDGVVIDITLADTTLSPNESTTGTLAYQVRAADVTNSIVVNVAEVTGVDPTGTTVSDEDPAFVALVFPDVAPPPAPEPPAPAPKPEVKPQVLAVTGLDTMRLALFAALIAGLGVMLLLGMDELPRARRRRAQG